MEQALSALARGQVSPHLLEAIQSLVDGIEGEYESLINEDESKLCFLDPAASDAFVRARAATALLCALKGDLRSMAYESYFVLDNLDDVRKLVGMPQVL